MIRIVCLLALVAPFLVADDQFINCSGDNKCFGAPNNCDPNKDCHTLLHFDAQNSLNFHLRNFTDVFQPRGYGSINLNDVASGSIQHLACVPYEQIRLKVVSTEESPFQKIEEMSDFVLRLPDNEFMCTFFAEEIPAELRNRDYIIAARGLIVPRVFQTVDPTSILLQPVTGSEPAPTSAALTAPDVLSVDENKMTSDLIEKMATIVKSEDEDLKDLLETKKKSEEDGDDKDLENMLKPGKKFSTTGRKNERRQKSSKKDEDSAHEEEEEVEEDTDVEEPRRKPKTRRPSRKEEEDDDEEEEEEERTPKRKSTRPSRYEEDDEEAEDEGDDEEQEKPPKRKAKRPSRRNDDEAEDEEEEEEEAEKEEEAPKNKKKSGDNRRRSIRYGRRMKDLEEEYDEPDRSFFDNDDYENSTNGITFVVILMLIPVYIFSTLC